MTVAASLFLSPVLLAHQPIHGEEHLPELVKAVAIPLPQPAHLMAPGLLCSPGSRLLSLLPVCLGCGISVLHDPAVHLMQHTLLFGNADRLASFAEYHIQQGSLLALVSDVLVADFCL